MQLELTRSTLIHALKAVCPEVPGKRQTSFDWYLEPLLNAGCTRIEKLTYTKGDQSYLIEGSKLGQALGREVTRRHIEAMT